MPSCPRCGVENAAGKAASWSCFASLSARPDQFREAAAAGAVREAAPARPAKTILLVVAAVVVLGAAAYFLVFRVLLQPGPATIGRKYLEAVKASDTTLQAQYATAAAMSRKTNGVALLKELGAKGVRPTEFTADTIAEGSGDARTLKATLTFAPASPADIADVPLEWREKLRQGISVPVTLSLIREGGGWKVNDVALSAGVPMPVGPRPATTAPNGEDGAAAPEGYVATTLTKVYHLPTCARAPKGRTAKRFATKEEAEDAGCRPCSI